MMYASKMAVAIKSQGRVLRERKDGETSQVFLPFGAEYSLMLKNLNSVRAIVKVWIDGTDVMEGTSGVIVPANSTVDIERFIKNGNMNLGNRFKFIERTAGVSAHRGNKIDDGLIRIQVEFERNPEPVKPFQRDNYWLSPGGGISGSLRGGEVYSKGGGDVYSYSSNSIGSVGGSAASYTGDAIVNQVTTKSSSRGMSGGSGAAAAASYEPQNDVGVTVAGSISNQSFTYGEWFPTDGVKHILVMQLLGELEGEPIPAPVTVQMKPTCTSCGKVNRGDARFCSECGTSLQVVGAYA